MTPAVLIVASTRIHVDPQEILRIQDTAAVLLEQGFAVDVLVPRISPLMAASFDRNIRVFTVPRVPFSHNPPDRPSGRRFLAAVLMFFRGIALAMRRDYAVLHGVNDGALVARIISRSLVGHVPCVAEVHRPFSRVRFLKTPLTALTGRFERALLRHASAIILPDEETLAQFNGGLPKARVSFIPDPHAELSPDAFTYGEFSLALEHIYDYVLKLNPDQ
jgi:hypothetical protein